MKVLVVSHKYPPSVGGMEKHCLELVQFLKRKADVVELIYRSNEQGRVSFFKNLKKNLKKLLQQHTDIDIIYLNDGLMASFCTWLTNFTKIPIVVTFHGLDIVFPNSLYQGKVVPKFFDFASAVSVSTGTYNSCLNLGFPEKMLRVIPNGVDHEIKDREINQLKIIDWFNKDYGVDLTNKRILLSMGRPVKRKGFSWFIENVFPQIEGDIVYVLIGPTSEKNGPDFFRRIMPKKWVDHFDLLMGASSDEFRIKKLLRGKRNG